MDFWVLMQSRNGRCVDKKQKQRGERVRRGGKEREREGENEKKGN